MTIKGFSRNDTDVFKGVAILCIMFHNFFHWISPSPGENEFDFYSIRIQRFFDVIQDNPLDIINILFSYFGHYGVQLFVFISGFGLAVSFCKRQRSWGTFMIERLKKLYPLLLTGIIVFVFAKILINKQLLSSYDINEISWKLLFIQTLLPGSGLSVNGPWWFFALIIQLYILFPLLFYIVKKYNTKGMIVIMTMSYMWIFISQYVTHCQWDVWLLQNAPGHIPEFVFGIWFALNKDKKISNIFGFIALIIFILGNFYKMFFPLTFLSLVFVIVWMINPCLSRQKKDNRFNRFLMFYGSISMILFAIHGYFRPPFISIGNYLDTFWGRLLAGILYVVFVTALALPAEKLYNYLVDLSNKLHDFLKRKTANILWRDKALLLISRVIQFFLLYYAISVVFNYTYIPKYVKERLTIYENSNIIEPSNHDLFSNIIEEEGNYYAMVKKDDTYSSLIPNVKIDKSYRIMKVNISFDVSYDESMKSELLPIVVFSCEKNNRNILWVSEEIKSESNEKGWRHVELSKSLIFNKNPKGRDLKVYLWNRHNQEMKYDNVNVKIHY